MRNTVTRLLAAAVLLACSAATSQATRYPNATFPDTLGILNIQFGLATPFPVNPDTVFGVQGVITGFDPLPTGFAIYMQDVSGNPWTGIDAFTGGTDNCGYQIGDLIAVYGKMQEFQGESEIEGLDAVQATRDIVIRKISSGNPLPPYQTLAISVAKEVPFAAPFAADSVREKWEGMRVRVNGPLRVVRTTPPNSSAGLNTFNSFLVVDNACTGPGACDSLFIDGSTLTNVQPPAVGTILTSVQGIYNQRTRGYRIQLQNADDLQGALPPNLFEAYSIGTNTYQVTFDREVTLATAEDENNYSTSGLRTCLTAVQVSPTKVTLTFDGTGAPAVGANETITVSGITAATTTTTMPDPQSRTFTNGIITIADIQSPSPDSLALAICKDVTKFSGVNHGSTARVSFRGVATAMLGSAANLQDASGGLRSGMQIFAPVCALIPGHQYLISAGLTEFGSGVNRETETSGTISIIDEGAVTPIQSTTVPITTLKDVSCDATQSVTNSEDYEGMLVKAPYGRVIRDAAAGANFTIQAVGGGAADTILIDNAAGVGTYTYDPVLNDVVSVTGVLRHSAVTGQSSFQARVVPRSNADILFHGNNVGVGPGNVTGVSFSVAPNPARTPRIDFGLPHKDLVELSVFDLQGRKLRVLANGMMEAGAYSRNWDGLDSNGQVAGAGVYFYRLKVGREQMTIRGIRVE